MTGSTTRENAAKAREMRAAGATVTEIAHVLGATVPVVLVWLRERTEEDDMLTRRSRLLALLWIGATAALLAGAR